MNTTVSELNETRRFFASDNCAAVHPAVLKALSDANGGHAVSYGDDHWTASCGSTLSSIFSRQSALWFVYNGTGANVIAIKSLLRSWQSVLAPVTAHIEEDECGSLEAISGNKIEILPQSGAKIHASDIAPKLGNLGFVHRTQPGLVSVTQSTELGLVYSIEEMTEIGKVCADRGLYLHMDGARIANAVASIILGTAANGGTASGHSPAAWRNLGPEELKRRGEELLRAMTLDAGVHALSLGGTKNGLMFGEGIVLMNGAESNADIPFIRKQSAQLASKMRYISAQFDALYGSDLWLRNALNANEMALRMRAGLEDLSRRHSEAEITFVENTQANAVFVRMPAQWAQALMEEFRFYPWVEADGSYRIMCSWDTSAEDVDAFLKRLAEIAG